jgi:hypothetical protein
MDAIMSKQSHSGKKPLVAKAIHMVYGYPGNLLKDWEAQPLDADTYRIFRNNGTHRDVRLHESILVRGEEKGKPASAMVTRSESGVLMVGNQSVIIGRNIKHGFQARRLAKNSMQPNKMSFLLLDDKLRQEGRVTVGDKFEGKNVSLIDGHLLQVGEDIYPIVPPMHEVTLLVMASPYEGGYLSYINVVEQGNKMNRLDGAMGALIPPQNKGEPAQFVEVFGGKSVVTARFWLESSNKKLGYQFRHGETALQELKIQEELDGIRRMAIAVGIEPEDMVEYSDAMNRLKAIQTEWETAGMALVQGARMFEPHSVRDELEQRGISYGIN